MTHPQKRARPLTTGEHERFPGEVTLRIQQAPEGHTVLFLVRKAQTPIAVGLLQPFAPPGEDGALLAKLIRRYSTTIAEELMEDEHERNKTKDTPKAKQHGKKRSTPKPKG